MIHKSELKGNFVSLSNSLAQDKTMTYELKGLLLELMSRPEDWTVKKEQLRRAGIAGHGKLNRIIKEGRARGYIYLQDIRDGKQQIKDRIWHISDRSMTPSEWVKKLKNENPIQGKLATTNKELTQRKMNDISRKKELRLSRN